MGERRRLDEQGPPVRRRAASPADGRGRRPVAHGAGDRRLVQSVGRPAGRGRRRRRRLRLDRRRTARAVLAALDPHDGRATHDRRPRLERLRDDPVRAGRQHRAERHTRPAWCVRAAEWTCPAGVPVPRRLVRHRNLHGDHQLADHACDSVGERHGCSGLTARQDVHGAAEGDRPCWARDHPELHLHRAHSRDRLFKLQHGLGGHLSPAGRRRPHDGADAADRNVLPGGRPGVVAGFPADRVLEQPGRHLADLPDGPRRHGRHARADRQRRRHGTGLVAGRGTDRIRQDAEQEEPGHLGRQPRRVGPPPAHHRFEARRRADMVAAGDEARSSGRTAPADSSTSGG